MTVWEVLLRTAPNVRIRRSSARWNPYGVGWRREASGGPADGRWGVARSSGAAKGVGFGPPVQARGRLQIKSGVTESSPGRRILGTGVGCRSRRDTRDKRGYDGVGSAGVAVGAARGRFPRQAGTHPTLVGGTSIRRSCRRALGATRSSGVAKGAGFGPQIKSGATDPGDGGWVLVTARYPRQARV